MKVELGQTVYIVKPSYRLGYPSETVEGVVTKIGRKYFEINDRKNPYNSPFEIASGVEKTESNYARRAYESKQQIEDERRFEYLSRAICRYFGKYGKLPLSLEQLEQINTIIHETT